jgi:hypothetical protein
MSAIQEIRARIGLVNAAGVDPVLYLFSPTDII